MKGEIQNIKLVIDLVTKIEMYYFLSVMFQRIPVALNWEARKFSGKKELQNNIWSSEVPGALV